MVNVREGQTATLTAAPDDPTGNLDPEAQVTWTETDGIPTNDHPGGTPLGASSGFVSTTPNNAQLTAAWAAAGVAWFSATATDPDGNAVESAPFGINCLAATDTATVVITGTVQ